MDYCVGMTCAMKFVGLAVAVLMLLPSWDDAGLPGSGRRDDGEPVDGGSTSEHPEAPGFSLPVGSYPALTELELLPVIGGVAVHYTLDGSIKKRQAMLRSWLCRLSKCPE